MRRSIAREFAALPGLAVNLVMTLDARFPPEPGPWRVVPVGPSDGLEKVARVARECDCSVLIAPETNGILVELTRKVEAAGARTLGSSVEAVELTGDKSRTSALWEQRGIPTPTTVCWKPTALWPEGMAVPAVFKPIDGAGSLDTFYLACRNPLPANLGAIREGLLQPFVPGVPMSASLLVTDGGEIWTLATGRQRIKIQRGRFRYLGGELPVACGPAESVVHRAVGAIPGLRGFVGVDFIWDPRRRRVTLLEINPRPTTSCMALGRLLPPGSLASAWLAACGDPRGSPWLGSRLAEWIASAAPIRFDPRDDLVARSGGLGS